MSRRITLTAVAVAVAAAGYGLTRYTAAAPIPAEADTRRFLPVENHGVFWTMGARVWKLHLTAADLRGRTQVVAKMRTDRVAEPQPLTTGRLKTSRNPDAALDVTFILFADTPHGYPEKMLQVAIDSPEFYVRRPLNAPVRQVNQFSSTNDPTDPARGIPVAKYSSRDSPDWAEFSLWVE